MPLKIAIIGLNQIGASIGLAFSDHKDIFTCVGYDEEPGVARQAAKLGATTKSYLALHQCVKDTKVIILACPLDEVKENLSIIAEYAPEGTVVIDTSPVKTAVAEWAQEILPEEMYFTGWTLALNLERLHAPEVGIEAARADLFENSYIGINDPPKTPEEVLTLSSNLASLLGAKPFFVGSVEADGLIAMGHELPRVAALALMLATADSSGWHEARKLASADYAKGSLPVFSVGEREELGLSMLLNRENVTRLIDDLIRSLRTLQSHLNENDAKALKKDIETAIHQRVLWLEQRKKMSWGTPDQVDHSRAERPSLLGDWLQSKLNKGKDSQEAG